MAPAGMCCECDVLIRGASLAAAVHDDGKWQSGHARTAADVAPGTLFCAAPVTM